MKSEYCNIASHSRLREAIRANRKARDGAKACMGEHSLSLLKSLAPDSLWNGFMKYVSPLAALYELFTKEKR